MEWTPNPFNLLEGFPFEYSDDDISVISGTGAFDTGIKSRDGGRCVVCGIGVGLQHSPIVPKGQHILWNQMKQEDFVPEQAKGVAHEARNGVMMCANHHVQFDQFYFYIRWLPEQRRFVFINHSQDPDVDGYHGQAINLHAGDPRLPFHGAFLIHEGRVRAHWPLNRDRAIPSPIPWVPWINPGGGRGGNNGEIESVDIGGAAEKVFIPTNPFTNPATLEALKTSFAKQPTWKAAVREGTTWEGNADENAAKWRRLNHI